MYLNLPKMNFDVFNNIRIFLMYKYTDMMHKTPYFVNAQIINLSNKLDLTRKNYSIYNLFNLESFIDQVAVKYNTNNTKLYQTIHHKFYYFYCEFLHHQIFNMLFLNNKTYSILCMTNHDKNIPFKHILDTLYPTSTFKESCYFQNNFSEISIINNFIQYCNAFTNAYHFIIIDLDIKAQSRYSMEELILLYFCYLVNILSSNGSCIIRLPFPKTMLCKRITLELLCFIGNCFQHVVLLNPLCSKHFEPEFYLLCRNFQKTFYRAKYMNLSLSLFQNIIYKPEGKNVYSFLNFTIPLFYQCKLNDLLNQFLYEYIECLQQIYNYHIHFDKNKLDLQCKKRVLRAKHWINSYSVIHKHGNNSLQKQEIQQLLHDIVNVIELCYD